MNQKNYDTIVLGAGISGLTCAFILQRRGRRVLLLEKAARFGGAIRSARDDAWLIEAGPNSTLETNPLLTQLIVDAGVEDRKLYASDASKNRYILRDGRLTPLPMSPPAFFTTKLFSTGTKLGLFREPFIPAAPPDAQETVAEFVRRRLGREFLDYAINPFVAGVYAGDPELLSVRAAFPKLYELEQKYGSLIKGTIKGARERKKRNEESKQSARMFSFLDGMQTLTDALANTITDKRHGVDVHAVTPATADPDNGTAGDGTAGDARFAVRFVHDGSEHTVTARDVIIATPAEAAAALARDVAPELGTVLSEIPYPPVAEVITGFTPTADMHPLDGFGFLIPKVEKRRILGTIFSSTIFRERAPAGRVHLTTFIGGMRQPEEALKSDDDIAQTALAEQHALLGTPMTPDFIHVTSWKHAIPQYVHGHLARMAAVDAVEAAHPGLHFCANYRGGISVGDCVKSAHGVVDRIVA
ncbi:MAG: protoporphyrinogen oxidase [Bacteroidota bacterium]|jgi:oxygen-dependent protoporphyrinogen oxidase|nr:protoporphyrinogen oxidase [Bacteroidota bacterium]